MASDGRAVKKATRREVHDKLSKLTDEDITEKSLNAQKTILSLDQYRKAARLSVYLSMPTGEARTNLIVETALADGKAVFVPYLHSVARPHGEKGKRKIMDMLRLASLEEYHGLARDAWGIPSLDTASVDGRENALGGKGLSSGGDDAEGSTPREAGLNLVVVPAVAFDEQMNRLGHGGGFYDNFLTRLCQGSRSARPYLVGLCLEQQILAPSIIKMEEWDWKVDAVAVGDGRLLS